MEKRKQTLAQFASSLGVTYETTRKWVTGATAPSRKRLLRICELLDVPPEEILFGPSGPSAAVSGASDWLGSSEIRERIDRLSPERVWALGNVVRAFLGAEPLQAAPLQGMIQSVATQLSQLPEDSEEARQEKAQRVMIAMTIAQRGASILPALARNLPEPPATPAETKLATASARQRS